MKRLICVVLCLLTLVVGLVSCGGSGKGDPDEVERPNLTLKMAIVVDDKTTDEGIKAMQDAFNAECEVALNTRIEFVCLKASDYEAQLDAIMLNVKEAKANLAASKENEKAESAGGSDAANTADGEFPEASAAQFDIVLVTGKDMYNKYIENGWIVGLNSYLNGTYKVLNTKILDTVKKKLVAGNDENIYGIPSLRGMGEYTYLSVNKKALEHYNIPESEIKTVGDANKLLLAAYHASATNGLDKWEDMYKDTTFSPILNKEEDFVYPTVKYLSQDGSFSFAGALYEKDSLWGNMTIAPKALHNSQEYKNFLETQFLAKKNGYYGSGSEEEYLFGLCKGDYSLRFSNPDYYYCVVDNPVLSEEEVFQSLLCVSAFSSTKEAARSVEVIQELMTNTTRTGLLNILLYGVPQENYTLEDGVVQFRLNYNYAMHRDYMVGNLAETAYPCTDYGQNSKTYANVVDQNKDMGKRETFFDDSYGTYFAHIDQEKWAWLDQLSETYYAELMACDDLTAYRAKIAEVASFLGDESYTVVKKPEDPGYYSDTNQIVLLIDNACNTHPGTPETLGSAFFAYVKDKDDAMK